MLNTLINVAAWTSAIAISALALAALGAVARWIHNNRAKDRRKAAFVAPYLNRAKVTPDIPGRHRLRVDAPGPEPTRVGAHTTAAETEASPQLTHSTPSTVSTSADDSGPSHAPEAVRKPSPRPRTDEHERSTSAPALSVTG